MFVFVIFCLYLQIPINPISISNAWPWHTTTFFLICHDYKMTQKTLKYCILSSIVHTFLHWKWCWNIPWNIHGMGLRWLLWWIKMQWLILVKLFLKNRNNFFFQKSLWNSGAHYNRMHIILNKIRYISLHSLKPIWSSPFWHHIINCLKRRNHM